MSFFANLFTSSKERAAAQQEETKQDDLARARAERDAQRERRHLATCYITKLYLMLEIAEQNPTFLNYLKEGRDLHPITWNEAYTLYNGRAHKPYRDGFSILADDVYKGKLGTQAICVSAFLPGYMFAIVGFTQLSGRSHFIKGTEPTSENKVAGSNNLKMALERFNQTLSPRISVTKFPALRTLVDSIGPNDILGREAEILGKLESIKQEEVETFRRDLDRAIMITDNGFFCLVERCMLDVTEMEVAWNLMATQPDIQLPIKAIKRRALTIAREHGAPGLAACARVFYELSKLYFRQHKFYAQSGLQAPASEDAQKKADKYANYAIKAATTAAESYTTTRNQQIIKALGLESGIGTWIKARGPESFEDFAEKVKTDLAGYLLPPAAAPDVAQPAAFGR